MAILLLLMVIAAVAGIGFGATLLAITLLRRRLASLRPPDDPRLAEQAERIDALEAEIDRLREQADFTERLLSERGVRRADHPDAKDDGADTRP